MFDALPTLTIRAASMTMAPAVLVVGLSALLPLQGKRSEISAPAKQ